MTRQPGNDIPAGGEQEARHVIPHELSGKALELYKRWLAADDRVAGFAASDPSGDRRDREVWSDEKRAEYRRAMHERDRVADDLYEATDGRWPEGY